MNESQLQRIFDKAERLNIEFDANDTSDNKLQSIASALELKNFNTSNLNVLENKLDDRIAQMNYGEENPKNSEGDIDYLDSNGSDYNGYDNKKDSDSHSNDTDDNLPKKDDGVKDSINNAEGKKESPSTENGVQKKDVNSESKKNNTDMKDNPQKGSEKNNADTGSNGTEINQRGKRLKNKNKSIDNAKNSSSQNRNKFTNLMSKYKQAKDNRKNKPVTDANNKDLKHSAMDKIKEKGKEKAKEATRKVAVKGLKLLLKTPVGWVILGFLAFLILLLIILAAFTGKKDDNNSYYAPMQDFNNAQVVTPCPLNNEESTSMSNSTLENNLEENSNSNPEDLSNNDILKPSFLNADNKNQIVFLVNESQKETNHNLETNSIDNSGKYNYSLEQFVIQSSYTYTKDISDPELIKAILVVYKTNILSMGNYNSISQTSYFNFCFIDQYLDKISSNEYARIKEYYDEVYNYLYLGDYYNGPINSLSNADSLKFDQDVLEYMKNVSGTFEEKLNSTYNEFVYKPEDNKNSESNNYPNFFIGDSRTSQMRLTKLINNNNTVYGAGYGYYWFVGEKKPYKSEWTNAMNGGINEADSKIDHSKKHNIIIWLGVNDLRYLSAQTYYDKYYELATGKWSNHNLFIVEVGPSSLTKIGDDPDEKAVENRKELVRKTEIFNQELSSLISKSGLSNLKYIGIDYNITEYDEEGLHYNTKDYVNIYNAIIDAIGNGDAKKALYDMREHNILYNLSTINTEWWFPIGSKEKTVVDGKEFASGQPDTYRLTSPFGYRNDPVFQGKAFHKGQDIGASKGVYVIAAKDGTITNTVNSCIEGDIYCGGMYGNHIYIDHGDGITSRYAHLETNSVVVTVGEKVKQGQIIAKVGHTGKSTAPHLHFEIRINDTPADPMNYINADNPRAISMSEINYTGSGNGKADVCKALLSSGLSKNAVVGIMINLQAESNFQSNRLEGSYHTGKCSQNSRGEPYGWCVHKEIGDFGKSDEIYTNAVDNGSYTRDLFINDAAGYGLVQWTAKTRKQGLYDMAKSKGKSISDVGVQLSYLFVELEKNYSYVNKYVNGNYDASEIGKEFCLKYEIPSNSETRCPKRVSDFINELKAYVNNGCA